MIAASYCRVSTEEQVEGLSLRAQQHDIREYCDAKGWNAPDEFVDEGHSARSEATDKRPALKALLEACQEGRYEVVVVYSLDRWSRNLKVTLQTFGTLADSHVAFASVTESIDYSTPEGRLFVAMLGAFAQYFSDSLAKHTSKGIAERVRQGRPAGPIPFGYRKNDSGVPEPVHHESAALVEIFTMRVQGKTHSELALWLNERGLRTRRGRRFDNFAVRDILANPFYTGRLRYRNDTVAGSHEGLVNITLYESVQAMRVPRQARPEHHDYLLRGLARCAHCGRLLWATSPHHGYTYYRQQGSARDCPLGDASVPCKVIDAQLEKVIGSFRLEPGWRESIVDRVVALSEKERIASERRQAEDRLRRLGRAYIDGLISERPYEAEHRHLQERIASLTVPEVDVAMEAGVLLEKTRDLWREATVQERHDLLSAMLEAVYVDLPSRRMIGITPKGPFRQAFSALEGDLLVPPEEANQILLWWRRRGIEPLVQRKTHSDIYKLSRRLHLARRTSTDGVTDGPAD